MSNGANPATKVETIVPVERTKTRNGTLFNMNDNYWRFSTNSGAKNFDLSKISRLCSSDIEHSVRRTLSWYLENRSIPHAFNLFSRFLHFLDSIKKDENEKFDYLTHKQVDNYYSNLNSSNEWYLGSLRGFFLKWKNMGYSGIDPSAAKLLEEITIKGNQKGWAVLTMDENEGPFTDIEFRLIREVVRKAFGEGGITLRQASLVWLFMVLGLRSAQVADLKLKDFEIKKNENGIVTYLLNVPRVKQRNCGRRKKFKKRELEENVGAILEAWHRQVVEDFGSKVADERELPFFPCVRRIAEADPGFFLHSDSINFRNEIKKMFEKLAIVSPRTGELMKVIPQRFRYTLGTRAVMYGAGEAVVAELLDHSDVQNVLVYTKLSGEILEELNAELADEMEPLARAFKGEIVLFDKSDLSDPSRLIAYPGIEIKKGYAGKCRCGGECGDVPPIYCYPCEHFTAYKGAPHEEALELMLAEQKKERDLGNEVVARQIQDCIGACRMVIRKCQEES